MLKITPYRDNGTTELTSRPALPSFDLFIAGEQLFLGFAKRAIKG